MQKLTIAVVVGYMLKVLKSGKVIAIHKKEFDAIRHADYIKFINLVNGDIPHLVTYSKGLITSGQIPPSEADIDFALLVKSGPSLIKFYKECFNVYGAIEDCDISDTIFESAALFEISLRMHGSNNKLSNPNDVLEVVIDRLCSFKNLTKEETIKIQNGRRFLNMIKHYKGQFPSWQQGINCFLEANSILTHYMLTIL